MLYLADVSEAAAKNLHQIPPTPANKTNYLSQTIDISLHLFQSSRRSMSRQFAQNLTPKMDDDQQIQYTL